MNDTTANPSPSLPFSGEGVVDAPLIRGDGGVTPLIILNRRTDLPATDRVALAYDERKRSRLKVTLASGKDAGIFLERGDHLHGGDRLLAEDGSTVVEIVAAPELLSEAAADTPLLFARAAYHLGNRHVPVHILPEGSGGGTLRFQTDHVLAEMLRGLGCRVAERQAPFEPESGAYGGQHAHGGHSGPGDAQAARPVPKIHHFKPR